MSHQGFDKTFKEFKEDFYSKIGDGSCLNVLDINLLKVVLDGLKVQYNKRGEIVNHFSRSTFVVKCYFLIKILLDTKKRVRVKKKISSISTNTTLIGFSNRYISQNGIKVPIYYQKIFIELGRDKFCYITDSHEVFSDLSIKEFAFGFNIFSKQNWLLFKELRIKLKADSFVKLWTEDELENINISSFLFFINFVKWDYVLKHNKFKKALLTCHYHNEAFILACKRHNIEVNELQHGLISVADIFYVFPQQVKSIIKKALFPDLVYVYGEFWKDVLLNGCEYSEEQIKVLGYYQFESNIKSDILIDEKDKKIILITTQYSADEHFIKFIKGLSLKLTNNWIVIVKTHPQEKMELYLGLENECSNVKVVNEDLDTLICKSEFLVTIFSTTIFDALRLNRHSFSLNIPLYEDYVKNLVEIGASNLLEIDENPTEILNSLKDKKDIAKFYSIFSKSII